MEISNASSDEIKLPSVYWNRLPREDQEEYFRIRKKLHSSSVKEKHGVSLSYELKIVRDYVERRSDFIEERAVVCGIFFANTFIAVNNQQLKVLLGRCKSSINNCFVLLGYISVKTKIRQCIETVLPILTKDKSVIRKWTIRCQDKKIIPFSSQSSAQRKKKTYLLEPPTQGISLNDDLRVPLPTPIINQYMPPIGDRAVNQYRSPPNPMMNAPLQTYVPNAVLGFNEESADVFHEFIVSNKDTYEYNTSEQINWGVNDQFVY
jgi:hypothetical protein